VVAAFENVLGRRILVPPHREVLGAYGAAISVQERMLRTPFHREAFESHDEAVSVQERMLLEDMPGSTFRGLESAINDRMEYKEKTCRADPNCHNQCKLKIYDFDGRRSVWGGECGRYELTISSGQKRENFFTLRQDIWKSYMAGVYEELKGEVLMQVDNRPTVGMQSALYGQQTAILWAHFFDRLGFRLVMTPPTTTHISKIGIETMVAETCYPVKVSHGHIKTLIGKTQYLFLPTIITMPTPVPSETGFYCPMVQSNSYMVRMALDIDPSTVLSPVLHLKYDPDLLAIEIAEQIQSRLRVSKKEIKVALYYALERQDRFIGELYQKGRSILEEHDPDEPMVVVTGRPYNLYDERLNLRLGRNLAKIGVAALPMDFMDVTSVDLSDFPSMYWGLGASILRTAKFIQANPNYFGLHLTNFGCGADSFLEHFYRHIMGDKPYLILELDEHSAVAGVMTRIEAYRNVMENAMQKLKVRSFEVEEVMQLAN
jgi:predicted nucleotide-binding protein (sugar kinase/HSP70/actin superfamily)